MPGRREASENTRQRNRKLEVDNQQLTERLEAARENNRFLATRIARLEAEVSQLGQRTSEVGAPI